MNFKKILMFGESGLVSFRIKEILRDQVITFGHQSVNFENPEQILRTLEEVKPDLIINAAAYTAVDLAEDEIEKSNQVNGFAVGVIADWAFKNNSYVIHFSTDYVFDGTKTTPYMPDDKPHPINQYGHSKLLGEQLLQRSGCQYTLFRISWIYDERGKNFYTTMLRLMNERPQVSVVNDQQGMPTSAKWVAEQVVNMIKQNQLPEGITHLAPQGLKSWYDFAVEIKQQHAFKCDVIAITTAQFVSKAKRPLWSKIV